MIRRRQLQMAPAALLAHAVVTLCATSIALALASDVAPPPSAADSTRVAALVTLLRLCSRASEPLRYVALPAFIVLASAPWLLAIWLRAGEIDEPLTEHARAVRALYLRALALWASCAAYAGALILVALALFHVASRAFDTPPARMIGGVVVALPFLFALIHPLTLLDSA
ncbi:MAG TPA: hypothetical protein VHZ95_17055, partial [Polyangiales bacterium]|nr:hypothetical protein [Polyangiales bacterium]